MCGMYSDACTGDERVRVVYFSVILAHIFAMFVYLGSEC